jgi:hypothetical protein
VQGCPTVYEVIADEFLIETVIRKGLN